jgi:hypothetical protein
MLVLLACSFSYRGKDEEPNPLNMVLGSNVERILGTVQEPVLVVAQWEIALWLDMIGVKADLVVNPHENGAYLSTDDILEATIDFAALNGLKIDAIIPVARPGLHLFGLKWLIRKKGYKIKALKLNGIMVPDRVSEQWWTMGSVRLFCYTALRVLAGEKVHRLPAILVSMLSLNGFQLFRVLAIGIILDCVLGYFFRQLGTSFSNTGLALLIVDALLLACAIIYNFVIYKHNHSRRT